MAVRCGTAGSGLRTADFTISSSHHLILGWFDPGPPNRLKNFSVTMLPVSRQSSPSHGLLGPWRKSDKVRAPLRGGRDRIGNVTFSPEGADHLSSIVLDFQSKRELGFYGLHDFWGPHKVYRQAGAWASREVEVDPGRGTHTTTAAHGEADQTFDWRYVFDSVSQGTS